MTTSIELEVAKHFVDEYVDESENCMAEHRNVMECYQCEDWLQRGIEAFNWIRRAEDVLNTADRLGLRDLTAEEQVLIDELYRMWLRPCARTELWIRDLDHRGYQPDNLAAYRATCEDVRANVEDREWAQLAAAAFNECTTAE